MATPSRVPSPEACPAAPVHCSLLLITWEGRKAAKEVLSLGDFRRGQGSWENAQQATMGTQIEGLQGLQGAVSQLWLATASGATREGVLRDSPAPHSGKLYMLDCSSLG